MTPRLAGGPETTARRIAWLLLVASVILFITLSPQTLYALGIPYDAPEGAFPTKLHIGTYVLLAAWTVALCSHGNPLGVMLRQARQAPLVHVYLACMVAMFLWVVSRSGPSGLAFVIDTLWVPAIALLALRLHSPRRHRQMLLLMMALLLLNAALALAEFSLGKRLVPVAIGNGRVFEDAFFRSSALMGHPLSNSIHTIALLPAALLLPWRLHWRLLCMLVLGLALLAFGGRGGIAALGVYALLALLQVLMRSLRGGFGYRQVTGGLLGAVLAAAAITGVVAATGLGERIFKTLVWDNSANVRLQVWEVLEHFSGEDLWMGMSIPRIDSAAMRVGLDLRFEAIENFWLYLLLLLGVIGFTLFVVGLLCLLVHLWRISSAPMRAAIIVYLALASTANTLSSKNISLILLTLAAQSAALGGLGATALRQRAPAPLRARLVPPGALR